MSQRSCGLVVCDQADGQFDFLIQVANKNVDLPYFGGPWTDYQCDGGTTSGYITSSDRPRLMRLS